jgi:hypothetical protein
MFDDGGVKYDKQHVPAYGRGVMVSSRLAVTAAAAVLTAAATVGAIWGLRGPSTAEPVSRADRPSHTTPARTPPPAVSRSTPTPQRPLKQYVPAAAPTGFIYRGHGVSVWAHVCGMNYVRPLDPPGEQHHTVCWVQHDFGYAPGSAGRGTTYVLGHAWAEDPAEVLNPVSRRATAQVLSQHRTSRLDGITIHPVTALNGDVITLRTRTGLLRYTVRSAYAVDKSQAGYIGSLMDEHIPDRVVLITCAELHGVDYEYNIVANAFLTTAARS